MRFIISLVFVFSFFYFANAQDINIIPQPAHLVKNEGSFIITKSTSLVIPNDADIKTAEFLNSYLQKFYGFELPLKKQAAKNSIEINTKLKGDKDAYTFKSNANGISITGATYAGSFYGMQTLIQLLPTQKSPSLKIPSVSIEDEPRFAYRGMLLDVSRYFYPVEFVKKYIDFMALHKMNFFHWHLTDDPGWRIEIKKYPNLTKVGAWRNKKNIFQFTDTVADKESYGGYYTQEQIKEIVKYAQDRFITIIPEIEMPAHSLSALASYPELGCTGGPYPMPVKWDSYKDIFCAGNEKTFEFIENVLDEVMALFPSPYIHVGGDECPKDRWKFCLKCQARIKNENLKDENELQSYFIKRVEKYINSKGKTMIGWDEILEGGLAPNAVVMSWRGENGGIAAAKAKHKVIMTPSSYCYFDYPQTETDSKNVPDWMKVTTVETVYNYEPIPKELNEEQSHYVLGGQGNVWTEFISSSERVEYMIFPRMSALSEVLWRPKDKRNFDDFKNRMIAQFKRYDLWKVNYCKAIFDSTASTTQHKYFFNSKATSEGNGTKEYPYTSLQKLSQLALQPGDSVFFHGSDTLTGNVSLNNINGIEEHNIVFTSYGNGKSIINGKNTEALIINGSSYFQILNIAFAGAGRKTGNTTDGLKLINCKNIAVKNIDVSGFQKSGLLLYNCEVAEVDNVFAHENGATGILVDGDYQKRISNNIQIINCRAEDNPGDPTNLNNHSGNGILVGNCKNVLIEYCTATNNGWDMPRIGNGPVGIWCYEADSVIIQHCISYRNKTAKGAADGGGFDLDGGVTNSIIQYCLSYENWGSGYGIYQYWSASKWNNNIVRYCISINDGFITDQASGMYLWNGWNGDSTFTNFYAYKNFFYNDRKYAFGFSPLCHHHNFNFFNNVFVASDTSNIYNGIDSSLSDVFLGNVWMRKSGGFMQNSFTDFSKWSEATGYEQHAKKIIGISFQKKLFDLPEHIKITDPHKLKTNSLLLSLCNKELSDKGIDIKKMPGIDIGKIDFFGNAITSEHAIASGICY